MTLLLRSSGVAANLLTQFVFQLILLLTFPAASFAVSPVFVRNYEVGGTLFHEGRPVAGAPILLTASSHLRNSQTDTIFENQVTNVVVITDSEGRFGPIDMPCFVDSETNSGFAPLLAGRALVIGQSSGFTIRSGAQCDEPDEPYRELLPFGNTHHPDRRNLGPNCGDQTSGGLSMHPSASVGEPVNVTNGNMWLAQTDYALPGVGVGIRADRVYNSGLVESGLFGVGWRSPFDESVTSYAGGAYLELRTETGKSYYFARDQLAASRYRSAGAFLSATRNDDGSFTVEYEDRRQHRFHPNGRIAWQRDRNGVQTTFNYSGGDGAGDLVSVTDGFGRSLRIVVAFGTVQKICDGSGSDPCKGSGTVATYAYEPGSARLSSVRFADGSEFRFGYVEMTVAGRQRFFLTSVRDALDNVTEAHEYDAEGRAITSEKAGGVEHREFRYRTEEQPYTSVTFRKNVNDPESETRYFFDATRGTNVITEIAGMCSCGSGSERSTFEYDDALNLLKRTDAAGDLNRETAYTYDPLRRHGRPLAITDVYGVRKFTYDDSGRILTYQDRADSQTADAFTMRMEYDPNGNLKKATDALGNATTITYPASGNVGLPTTVTDARGNATKFVWNPHGLLAEAEDANGKRTGFTHDLRGRTTSVTNAAGHTTVWNYFDGLERRVEVVYPNTDKITYRFDARRLPSDVTDERGKITSYEFDVAYRLTRVTDPLGHSRIFGYDLMSNLAWQRDGAGNRTDYVYDEFNRLREISYPEITAGSPRLRESLGYDRLGRMVARTDTANRTTAFTYDDPNRIRRVTNPNNETTAYEFDARGHLTKLTDALDQAYLFVPDALGRVRSQTRAGAAMNYDYDANGNVTRRTDYSGQVTRYTYDKLNRLERIDYGAGDALQAPVTYAYDDLSRLISAANENGTVTFAYDNRNRITGSTDVFGRTVGYRYERTPDLNQERVLFGGELHAIYDFDDAGRIMKITSGADNSEILFAFDDADRLVSRAMPNGVVTTYGYDGMSRLGSLRDQSAAGVLFDRRYAFDDASRIGLINETGASRNFLYDGADRLASVTGSATEFYQWDDVGNRISSHRSASYSYDPSQYNQMTGTATASIGYDANGNIRTKSEGKDLWRYQWDFENRMYSAASRKQTVRYKYDALGRRIQRYIVGGRENTKFTYDGADVIADDNAGTLTKYLNGPGIDSKLRMQTGNDVRYFVADHIGSTNALTDASGIVTSSATYDSFGNAAGNLATRYRFTGREYDDFSGLHFYRARWYDGGLGRFISEDPIGFAGGDVNLYGYVGNGPLGAVDPTGLYETDVHFYLTWYLAGRNQCFSNADARYVAFSAQYVDENPATSPAFGGSDEQRFRNRNYHALNGGRHSSYLWSHWQMANTGPREVRLRNLGTYLHYQQDTFSHAGFDNPVYGHLLGTHEVDKTSTDVEKAMNMAKTTWSTLNKWSRDNCGCESQWSDEMTDTVRRFSEAPAGNWFTRKASSIEELDPQYLDHKRNILGLPER